MRSWNGRLPEQAGDLRWCTEVRPRVLPFYGHRAQSDGTPGPGCLSQWWPAAFTHDGVRYVTAEHWMMAAKARLFGDADAERAVLADASPVAAKQAGRAVRGFNEQVWSRERYGIVLMGTHLKFTQHPGLHKFLLSTGDALLVEASPYDRIWGIGLAADNPHYVDPARWRGLNLLGFALTQTRERLKAEPARAA
ncbi:NADAR family protein [Streptomyces sp. S1D4-20]|uniref:NADAR family protein n=1 Tax=Streptomyces sp. S1D4-20 TaxID=2594462 RepID=UPI001165988B|nr:NADAR family protein [Streptomyces sp. S1D4-20]QDN54072.1 NADAR family protein [Streptomyces sp. S1D4-20]